MSAADPNVAEQQRRYREFLDLLPLTINLAGLPTSDGKYYTEDQIETRPIDFAGIDISNRRPRESISRCRTTGPGR